jgi:hypothetical protein
MTFHLRTFGGGDAISRYWASPISLTGATNEASSMCRTGAVGECRKRHADDARAGDL